MGQVLVPDRNNQLQLTIPQENVKQQKQYIKLLMVNSLECPKFQKIFHYENYKSLIVTYKCFTDVYISLELIKQKQKQEPAYALTIGNEHVYGYKFKKNEKSEKIKSEKVYFRRKIYIPNYEHLYVKCLNQLNPKQIHKNTGRSKQSQRFKRQHRSRKSLKQTQFQKNYLIQKEELLKKHAQLKLLSKLDLGPKLGRFNDGSDGILTDHYIEFYSQIPINKGFFLQRQINQKRRLGKKFQELGFKLNENPIRLAYSLYQKGYILNISKLTVPTAEQIQNENENKSIKSMNKQFEEEVNIAIISLDGLTNMMTSIQNHLIQRDIDKAMEKFQANMSTMDENERIVYAEEMSDVLRKFHYYKSYEKEVSSFISVSKNSNLVESRNSSNNNRLMIRNSRLSEDNMSQEGKQRLNTGEFGTTSPGNLSPRSSLPLRFSEVDSKGFIPIEYEYSSADSVTKHSTNLESNYIMWQSALQRLKNSILQNDKDTIHSSLTCLRNLGILNPIEIQVLYGQSLMENGKTKHAKIIFQRLIYTKKHLGNDYLNSQIYSMLGFMATQKQNIKEALSCYEKSLALKFKVRNYSRKTTLIFNNLAALYYHVQNFDKSLLYLHRALKLNEYSSDYELLMKSNHTMILIQQGKIKEVKQLLKTLKLSEPYSNNQIGCKFYGNNAYLDLTQYHLDKKKQEKERSKTDKEKRQKEETLRNLLQKAKSNFEIACQIQQKFLIPNGYRPSLVLHNNFAMCYFQKKIWKKASFHLQKIENQLGQLRGLKALQIHFNFGKVCKQTYNYQKAIKHFLYCQTLLSKMNETYISKYKQKIESQIQKFDSLRIEECSEQSSHINKLSRLSKKSLITNKPYEIKMN